MQLEADSDLMEEPSDPVLQGVSAPNTSEAGPSSSQTELSDDTKQRISKASREAAATFGDIVHILARSERFKHFSLADLEWLVAPAIQHRQVVTAHARSKETGQIIPVAVVAWALLSEERMVELKNASSSARRLRPNEWRSGPIAHVTYAEGEPQIVAELLKKLRPATPNATDPTDETVIADVDATDASESNKEEVSANWDDN